ncbi:Zn-dependent exopeptidase [Basidiobolus meristosporus CBS 931.73]|uniref:Zn-dependent exopeptidase n=1 Tax=Basidiobolus meristosporus CBS 931.73 TaxID=1314790 RepID=A0A1Y1Z690_9FUNG|nr:Zn-dependent exopeptidase [Basidiobolus meristosporus CBS 931.73]|eukprot:ORY05771.1 Zn-dependent exopeptidase [Basidiobolus meristosporus CBS 931.73]
MVKLFKSLICTLAILSSVHCRIDQEELFRLHEQLVSINSVTGNEAQVTDFLSEYLEDLGWSIETQTVSEGVNGKPRENIFAHLGNSNPAIVVSSHVDTVPPFLPYRVEGDKIFGRGACDAKSSVAAQIVAVEQLLLENPDLDIREVDISKLELAPSALIIGEPTENKLVLGHKGIMSFSIESQGIAAHSGYPELGRSAISQLLSAIISLNTIVFPAVDPILGADTINIGLVNGVATNTTFVWDTITKTIGSPQGIKLTLHNKYEPVKLSSIEGFDTSVAKFNTDFSRWKGPGKNYLLGPGTIQVAHKPEEYITKSELIDSVELYKKLIQKIHQELGTGSKPNFRSKIVEQL